MFTLHYLIAVCHLYVSQEIEMQTIATSLNAIYDKTWVYQRGPLGVKENNTGCYKQ